MDYGIDVAGFSKFCVRFYFLIETISELYMDLQGNNFLKLSH
jgi:hypothetical protein